MFDPQKQNQSGIDRRAVGRELREKHWFSSQPSTNGSLLSKNYSRSVTPNSRFSRSRIFACAAVTSSFVSVRFFPRYVNLYASDFPELAVAVPSPISNRSNNCTASSNGSGG